MVIVLGHTALLGDPYIQARKVRRELLAELHVVMPRTDVAAVWTPKLPLLKVQGIVFRLGVWNQDLLGARNFITVGVKSINHRKSALNPEIASINVY